MSYSNYAKKIPRDTTDEAIDGAPPAYPSNQSQSGVPVTSSVVTLNSNTTIIEISAMTGNAGSGGIIGKWGVSSVTSSNFDFFVGSGFTRDLVVPVSVMGTASLVGANVANGLYPAVSLKTATAQSASVFTTEY